MQGFFCKMRAAPCPGFLVLRSLQGSHERSLFSQVLSVGGSVGAWQISQLPSVRRVPGTLKAKPRRFSLGRTSSGPKASRSAHPGIKLSVTLNPEPKPSKASECLTASSLGARESVCLSGCGPGPNSCVACTQPPTSASQFRVFRDEKKGHKQTRAWPEP